MFAGLPLIVTEFSRSNVRPSLNQDFHTSPQALLSRSCQQSRYTLATSTSRAIGSRWRGGAEEQTPRPAPLRQHIPPREDGGMDVDMRLGGGGWGAVRVYVLDLGCV